VVPVVWQGNAAAGATAAPLKLAPGTLLAVADHVNLELRGPLSGRWPADLPRSFPPLAGIYQPAGVRARGGARVYSSGVIVAGVADAGRLTPFEVRALREAGAFVVSDSLVPPAIVAAYYGLTLAACGVPRADANHEE
jgi:purine nucleoside phosphorylase